MFEALRGFEALAVGEHGGGRVRRAEVRREAVAEAHLPGGTRRVAAGAEQPDRRQLDVGRHRDHGLERMILRVSLAGERQEFSETLREMLSVEPVWGAAQGCGRDGLGARGAA